MEKRTSYKIIIGLIILGGWVLLLTGILRVPAWVWFIYVGITLIFYLTSTKSRIKKSRTIKGTIDDMEDYMERKAEERFGKSDDEEKSEEEEEEYDFGDDIEIIKK